MNSYQYLLFDWDGCLATTLELWLSTYKNIFAQYNIFPKDEEIIKEVFNDWGGALKLGINVNQAEEYYNKVLYQINQNANQVNLYPKVYKTLENLFNQDKQIALITNSKKENVQPALKLHKLTPFFHHILTIEDVKHHKPNPEMIYKAINLLKADKSKTLVIGDSESDLGAAQAAGVDSALFFTKNHSLFYDLDNLKSYAPKLIFDDFEKLLNFLN
jgi:pyrophosphatase PpaX